MQVGLSPNEAKGVVSVFYVTGPSKLRVFAYEARGVISILS